MFASRSKWIALGLVVAAVAAPTALAESPLAAKTEAAGFTAITQYLVQHASQSDTSALAAKTEATGFLALQPKPVDSAALGAKTPSTTTGAGTAGLGRSRWAGRQTAAETGSPYAA